MERIVKSDKPSRHVKQPLPPQRSGAALPHTLAQKKTTCVCDGSCPRCQGDNTLSSNTIAPLPTALTGGRPLDEPTQLWMSSRFNHDFSSVRIHTGAAAEASASAVNARAFTQKNHITFNFGEYAPHTASGQHLLAHELTHVVQQAAGPFGNQKRIHFDKRTEKEARDVAGKLTNARQPLTVKEQCAPGLARSPRSLVETLNYPSMSSVDLYREYNLIRQWLSDAAHEGSSEERYKLETALQIIEPLLSGGGPASKPRPRAVKKKKQADMPAQALAAPLPRSVAAQYSDAKLDNEIRRIEVWLAGQVENNEQTHAMSQALKQWQAEKRRRQRPNAEAARPPEPASLDSNLNTDQLTDEEIKLELTHIEAWIKAQVENTEDLYRLKRARERLKETLHDRALQAFYKREMKKLKSREAKKKALQKMKEKGLPALVLAYLNKPHLFKGPKSLVATIKEKTVHIRYLDGSDAYDIQGFLIPLNGMILKANWTTYSSRIGNIPWYAKFILNRPAMDQHEYVFAMANSEIKQRLYVLHLMAQGLSLEQANKKLKTLMTANFDIMKITATQVVPYIAGETLFMPSEPGLPTSKRGRAGRAAPAPKASAAPVETPAAPAKARSATARPATESPASVVSPTMRPQNAGGLKRLSDEAKATLTKSGLFTGAWRQRLHSIQQTVVDFINDFHSAPGFEKVVQDWLAKGNKRKGAAFVIRFAKELIQKVPKAKRYMSFERKLAFLPGGKSAREIDIVVGGMRYELKSWQRLYSRTVRKQFLKDMALIGDPNKLKWVFDSSKIALNAKAIAAQIRQILTSEKSFVRNYPGLQTWLDALEKIVHVK